MPFIRGRYHMNPIVGQAIEAAREAEAARLAQNEQGSQEGDDGGDDFGLADSGQPQRGPIHRVEIEAAELVPSHTGRAQHGYVARVHREVSDGSGAPMRQGRGGNGASGSKAETHVFSGHRDLISFLRDEFAKECAGK
ncbi:MAG: hypothetical protein WB780_04775 [Candidatus Acidiferrales bacterium]